MKRFEYKLIAPIIHKSNWEPTGLMEEVTDPFFNGMGRDGWEIVNTIPITLMVDVKELDFNVQGKILFVFKRELPDK